MRFELCDVLCLRRTWNTGLNDSIKASTYVEVKINPALARRRGADINANSPQIANNLRFFIVSSTKQPQDTAWELLHNSPAKRQPQPPITWVAKH